MKKVFKFTILALLFIAIIALSLMYISSHNIAVLNPKGLIAEKQRDLIFTASLLMFIVVIPVFVMTLVFAWKYREKNTSAKYTPDWEHSPIAETLWWGIPLVIIIILAVITWETSHSLNPFKPIKGDKKTLPIQVVALDWKWLFIYPEQGIATVNFVQFPEKTPLSFEITADAPMNSFWIPQLGGQIYAMPAMRTKLHLFANKVGTFRGASANLSGAGFAGMAFTAQATSQEDFDAWVESVKQTGSPLGFEEYNELTTPSEYNPKAFYLLTDGGLFDQILMKYMPPSKS